MLVLSTVDQYCEADLALRTSHGKHLYTALFTFVLMFAIGHHRFATCHATLTIKELAYGLPA